MSDTFNNEMTVTKNYDDIFLRSIIVAISAFMTNIITFKRYRNNTLEVVECPVMYSVTGDQRFITDLFLDSHQYPYSGEKPKADGNYNKIPSGVFTITEAGLQNQNVSGGNERLKYFIDEQNEHGITPQVPYTARGAWFPETFKMELEIRTASENERLKIYDVIIETLYKVRKTYINDYKGFKKIPLTLSFPESQEIKRNFTFTMNSQDKLPSLKLTLEVHTKRPIVDYSTAIKLDNKIKTVTVQGSAKTSSANKEPLNNITIGEQ